jgi:hypothetical protein
MKFTDTTTKLLPLLNNEQFVINTQKQIAKDFAKINLLFPTSFEEIRYSKDEIEELIRHFLCELIKEGEPRLLQLLYIIDLPENEILSIRGESDFLNQLSEKILYREAYKIFLRQKYM